MHTHILCMYLLVYLSFYRFSSTLHKERKFSFINKLFCFCCLHACFCTWLLILLTTNLTQISAFFWQQYYDLFVSFWWLIGYLIDWIIRNVCDVVIFWGTKLTDLNGHLAKKGYLLLNMLNICAISTYWGLIALVPAVMLQIDFK